MQDVIQSRGIDNIVSTSHRLGVTGDLPKVPSLVLGTGSVSVLDMATAYSTIASGGQTRPAAPPPPPSCKSAFWVAPARSPPATAPRPSWPMTIGE